MLAAVVTLEDALLQAGIHAGAAAWSWEGTCFQSLSGKFLQQVTGLVYTNTANTFANRQDSSFSITR